MSQAAADYLAARGMKESAPEALNEALRQVLESMEPMAYEDPARGLTAEEQAVLTEGGLRLERTTGRDLVAETAVKYAAIVQRSMTAEQVAKRLGEKYKPARVRKMIAAHALYSFLLDKARLVPDFQFDGSKLIANITQVNQALPRTMHPVGIYNWYHLPNADLYIDEEMETLLSPLEWLKAGRDLDCVAGLAAQL